MFLSQLQKYLMFQGKLFSLKHINNIRLLTVVTASGKEALTPVKIYLQAFSSSKMRRNIEWPVRENRRKIYTVFVTYV